MTSSSVSWQADIINNGKELYTWWRHIVDFAFISCESMDKVLCQGGQFRVGLIWSYHKPPPLHQVSCPWPSCNSTVIWLFRIQPNYPACLPLSNNASDNDFKQSFQELAPSIGDILSFTTFPGKGMNFWKVFIFCLIDLYLLRSIVVRWQ